jgi:hypothetical protein
MLNVRPIGEWLATGGQTPPPEPDALTLTVTELIVGLIDSLRTQDGTGWRGAMDLEKRK